MVSGSSDKTCILWDLNNGKALKTLKGHNNSIFDVYITPNGKRAISMSEDHSCILWDLNTGEALRILKGHNSAVSALSLSPDGKWAVSGSRDNTCILWDLNTGEAIKILKGHMGEVSVISITPDGKRAVSGSCDNTCILWDLNTGVALTALIGHTNWINALSITSDGRRAVSGSDDHSCILWDLKNGEMGAWLVSNSKINAISCFPGGIFGGEESGNTFTLMLDKKINCPELCIVTIKQIWDFELQQYLPPTADCPLCGRRFAPPALVLATINNITKKFGLRPEQSPCLELPDEAWEDPGLLGNCPKCGGELKFNPFIAGGDY
jgi:WD40 repeat protein